MTTASAPLPLTRSSVIAARQRIESHIHKTPVLTSSALNAIVSTPQSPENLVDTPWEGQTSCSPKINLFFKCENFQKIGAFKIRGATHALSRLSNEELARGVVTHSSGNHAQALALAAQYFGTTAHIVMPTISKPSKIAATEGYGAHVYFSGSTSQEREAVTREVLQKTGGVMVPPYDHPDIILGQGTMGLEIQEQVNELITKDPSLSVHDHTSDKIDPTITNGTSNHNDPLESSTPTKEIQPQPETYNLDALIAPLGGGGLLSGLALAFSPPYSPSPSPHPSPSPPHTLIFGAEPSFQSANDAQIGLSSTPPTRIPTVSTLTIADGLRTPVGVTNWEIISNQEYVKGVFSVTEEQILAAMRLVMERLKVVVEPSACVGLAAVMFCEEFRRLVPSGEGKNGWDVGIVLSGGNVSVEGICGLFGEENKGEMEREKGKVGLNGERRAENVPG
ncbi:uncharacterized protein KY384_006176 [Bacidia gigantensis]|uniref:uncharacterized protein n=1 Tax=Bacidia gigantensis TaxID=2732470 RepID=UPI001D03B095|nr:uncharacterized protein KY384_006176 [Bacidia gigantensis]KAG8529539.1 hypothetical protein KY384_006176 [Bacidia gigantensis]